MGQKATAEEPATPATGGGLSPQHTTEEPASPATGGGRRPQHTIDHGEIIHFAGRLRLFPVAKKNVQGPVRLRRRRDVQADAVRVGWPAYFRPCLDRHLVFVSDDRADEVVTGADPR